MSSIPSVARPQKRNFTHQGFELVGSDDAATTLPNFASAAAKAAANKAKKRSGDAALLVESFVVGQDEHLSAQDKRPLQFTLRWEGDAASYGQVEAPPAVARGEMPLPFVPRGDMGAGISCAILAVKGCADAGNITTADDVVILDMVDWSRNKALPLRYAKERGDREGTIRHSSAIAEEESTDEDEGCDEDEDAAAGLLNYADTTNANATAKRKMRPIHPKRNIPCPIPRHERIVVTSLAELTKAVDGVRMGWNPRALAAAVAYVKSLEEEGASEQQQQQPSDEERPLESGAAGDDDEDGAIRGYSDSEDEEEFRAGRIADKEVENKHWPAAMAFLQESAIVVAVIANAVTVKATDATSPAGSANHSVSVAVESVRGFNKKDRRVTDVCAPIAFPKGFSGSVLMYGLVNVPREDWAAVHLKDDDDGDAESSSSDEEDARSEEVARETSDWYLKPYCVPLEESGHSANTNAFGGADKGGDGSSLGVLVSAGTLNPFKKQQTSRYFTSCRLLGEAAALAHVYLQQVMAWPRTVRLVELKAQERKGPLADAGEEAAGGDITGASSIPHGRGGYVKRRDVLERPFNIGINHRPSASPVDPAGALLTTLHAEERRSGLEWLLMVIVPILAAAALATLARSHHV